MEYYYLERKNEYWIVDILFNNNFNFSRDVNLRYECEVKIMIKLNDYEITNYELIRDQIETGDILICSGRGLFSDLIQDFTDSDWSHVGMIIKFKNLDRIMVVESMEGVGFRLIPFSHYLHSYRGNFILMRHLEFKDKVDFKKLGKLVFDLQATRYDNREIFKIGLRIILNKLGITKLLKIKFKANNNNKYICSEAIKMLLSSFNIKIPFNKLGVITPSDFANWKKLKFLWRLK